VKSMKIEVKEYEPSKEVTYTTTEVFFAVDKETKVGLRVVGTHAQFVGWNSRTHKHDLVGLTHLYYDGIDIEVFQGLLAAYESRDS